MDLSAIWGWLRPTLEIIMAVVIFIGTFFFFLAVIGKPHARRSGIISGLAAIIAFVLLVFTAAGNIYWTVPDPSPKLGIPTFQFPIFLLFLCIGIIFAYFAFDARKIVKHKEASNSTLLLAIIFFIMSIILLIPMIRVFLLKDEIVTSWQDLRPSFLLIYPTTIDVIVIVVVPVILFAIGIYVLKELTFKKYESEIVQESSKHEQTFSKFDLELSRKLFHIIIVALLAAYLFVGRIVIDSIYQFLILGTQNLYGFAAKEIYDNIIAAPNTGLLDFRAGHLLILMAVTWILLILLLTDIVRIKKYRFYPFKMVAKVYRDKERLVFAPHIYLTSGILFVVMVSSGIDFLLNTPAGISVQIVMITVMISALADAVATLVGVTKGKHHLKGGKSKKTWEGLIAGVISALLFGIFTFLILMPQYGGDIGQGIILSLVATLIFGLIDYFSPPIPLSDNILNPIAIGLTLWGVALLFFL